MKINITQLYEDHHIEYISQGATNKHARAGWVQTHCPFCQDHGKFLLGFALSSKGKFNCWMCGYHTVSDTLMKLLNCEYREVKQIIEQYVVDYVHQSNKKTLESRAEYCQLPKPLFRLTAKRDNSMPLWMNPIRYLQYLHDRGFLNPLETAKKYYLHGTGAMGNLKGNYYKNRIIVPIIYDNVVVSFQSRDITGHAKVPYKASPIPNEVIQHKHILYNIDNAPRFEPVIVVEGIIDCWKMGRNTVATFGTGFTESQVRLLSEYKQQIYIIFDQEDKAQEIADTLRVKLQTLGCNAHRIELKEYSDPGVMPLAVVRQFKEWMFTTIK